MLGHACCLVIKAAKYSKIMLLLLYLQTATQTKCKCMYLLKGQVKTNAPNEQATERGAVRTNPLTLSQQPLFSESAIAEIEDSEDHDDL